MPRRTSGAEQELLRRLGLRVTTHRLARCQPKPGGHTLDARYVLLHVAADEIAAHVLDAADASGFHVDEAELVHWGRCPERMHATERNERVTQEDPT